ncbi:MAG: ATP-grasp domain-containing protein [Solirubrobacterales bacterium]
MRIAIASCNFVPASFTDDERLAGALTALDAVVEIVPWDREGTRWDRFDLVVVRSTWDYASRRDEFVGWAESVGPHLCNGAGLIRWNSDKRYLADLARSGIRVVDTEYLPPGSRAPAIEHEVVVKPAVSGGARDTGRFTPARAAEAHELIAAIHGAGKTAMLQPYNASVDALGETAVVMIDGAFSHALRKGAVLRPDEVAPVRDDGLGAAEIMYDGDLVGPGAASELELRAARDVVAELEHRFGERPLYARVDLLADGEGEPEVIELEAVEPNLYHDHAPGSAERFARAIVRRAQTAGARPDR